jgi:hypothetical protein
MALSPLARSALNIAAFMATTNSPFAIADLPVHCVQPQMLGEWRFHIGRYRSSSAPSGWNDNCGVSTPDSPDGHRHLTPKVAQTKPGGYHLSHQFQKKFFNGLAHERLD